jgi:F-type H+-transporting ATPase subunit b
MHIDWLTLIAQMLNFLLLVTLLKRFLYMPVLVAIAQREAHIAGRLQEAQDKADAAARQETHYRNALLALQTSQESLLQQASAEAHQQRQHLLEQARQEAQHLQARWYETLQQEQQAFLHTLRQQAGHQVCAVARQVLTDLAQADLEHRIIEVFLTRLAALDDTRRYALASAAQATSNSLLVRTAFPLPPDEQQRLRQAICAQLATEVPMHFDTDPALLCGIALEIPGQHKIAWTLEAYLEHFEEHFATLLSMTITAGGSVDRLHT